MMYNVYPDFPNWVQYEISNHPGNGIQAKIVINWQTGMKYNFDDIRFSDDNGSKIPYFIESFLSGISAIVWIKLTSSYNIYLRWGGGGKGESNGSKVFEFFDDFSGIALNTSKWTVTSGTASVSNSILTVSSSSNAYSKVDSVNNLMSKGYVTRVRAKTDHFGSVFAGHEVIAENQSPSVTPLWIYYSEFSNKNVFGGKYSWASTLVNISGWSAGTWHVQEIYRDTLSGFFKVDGSNTVNWTPNYSTIDSKMGFYTYGASTRIQIDWVTVGKYSTLTPTFTIITSGCSQKIMYSEINTPPASYLVKSNNIFNLVHPTSRNWILYTLSNHPGNGIQAKIVINWQTGMKYNFDDIRFNDDNGSKLNYYIESYTNGDSATVWLKLTSSSNIYLRWGSGGSSESDGENVFEFFDDFNGAAYNSSGKWISGGSTVYGNVILNNSIMSITSISSNPCYIYSASNVSSNNSVIEIKCATGHTSTSYYESIDFLYSSSTVCISKRLDSYGYKFWNINSTSTSVDVPIVDANVFHVYKLVRNNGSTWYTDDSNMVEISTDYPSTSAPIRFTVSTNESSIQVDWVRKRKLSIFTPTFTYVKSGYNSNIMYYVDPDSFVYLTNYAKFPHDMYFSCGKVSDNSIQELLYKQLVNDLKIIVIEKDVNNILYELPEYNILNDLNIGIKGKNINNIFLTKVKSLINDIVLSFCDLCINDTYLDKYSMSLSDIYTFLQKCLLNTTDMYLSNTYTEYNDIIVFLMTSIVNDMHILGGVSQIYDNSNVNVGLVSDNQNDIILKTRSQCISKIILLLTMYYLSTGIVREDIKVRNNSDLTIYAKKINIDDKFLFFDFYNENDFSTDLISKFWCTNDLMLHGFNEDVSYTLEDKTIESENDIKFSYRIKVCNDVINLLKKFLLNSNNIRLSRLIINENFFPAVLRIKNINNITGNINTITNDIHNIKLTVPFIEEIFCEKNDEISLYPDSNTVFLFDNKSNVITYKGSTYTGIFDNIPNCKGIAWFSEYGVEFYVFTKTIVVNDLYIYKNSFNYLKIVLHANTRIYHGQMFYVNKDYFDNENDIQVAIKDLLHLVKRIN